jgi:hypothetical protein
MGGVVKWPDLKAIFSQVEVKLPKAKSGIMQWITETYDRCKGRISMTHSSRTAVLGALQHLGQIKGPQNCGANSSVFP